MECTPGDRVELVATNDPYTRLRPGDRGTVTSVGDSPEPTIGVQWDNGSTPAILPDAGDQIRLLPSHVAPPPSTPASSPAMPEDPTVPRYPDIQVQLSGEDGNAFDILGRTTAALRHAGVPQDEIDAYFAKATAATTTTCSRPPCAGSTGRSGLHATFRCSAVADCRTGDGAGDGVAPPGDRFEPVTTDDPCTRLRTSDRIRKLSRDPTSSHTDPAPAPPPPTTPPTWQAGAPLRPDRQRRCDRVAPHAQAAAGSRPSPNPHHTPVQHATTTPDHTRRHQRWAPDRSSPAPP